MVVAGKVWRARPRAVSRAAQRDIDMENRDRASSTRESIVIDFGLFLTMCLVEAYCDDSYTLALKETWQQTVQPPVASPPWASVPRRQ